MGSRQEKKKRPRSVVRTLIHLGKMRIKRKTRHEKHKSPRHGPLIRRILLNSAHMLATPSIMSLQKLSNPNTNRITVNVGGTKYEIATQNLEKFPDTLLGSERKNYFYDEQRMEYFFDRDPVIFKNIAEFYRVGSFHVSSPTSICMEAILDELAFFGIPQHHVSDCCCEHIILGDEEQAKKKKQMEAIESKQAKEYSLWTAREKLWEFLTNTKSSKASAVFGYIFGAIVALNISTIVAETVPTKSGVKHGQAYHNAFFGLDSFCVGIFTIEYIARLYSAPHRLEFAREMSNVVDLLGIIPYYIGVVERAVQSKSAVLDFIVIVFRMFRVFRVTQLARHSERFQNLLLSVKGAATELGGILFTFLALMVTFSSIIYYFEKHEENTKFISIPAAFWYTLVTMTTLGYGDIVPTTVKGKLLGAACAMMGVLLLSLPVPIIERKLDEFGKKCKPKPDKTMAKLAASLPSLVHNSCTKHKVGDKKKRTLVHADSRTTSMLVEVGDSFSSTTESNSSFQSSFGSLHEIKNKVNEPLIEEPGFPDVNGNRKMSTEDARLKQHKCCHGNGGVSAGVGHGIFTESPSSSQYFPVCHQLSASSGDDAVEERTPSESFAEDDKEKKTIPMRNKLRRQWSFDGGDFLIVVPPRNCQSVGDLA